LRLSDLVETVVAVVVSICESVSVSVCVPAVLVWLVWMWERERLDPDLEKWRVSVSAWGTILVTGLDSMKTVSKQEFGGRNVRMMAVVDMSGVREVELLVLEKVVWPDWRVEQELELLLVLTLLVARGGRQEKVALIFAVLSWLDNVMKSSEAVSDMV